MIPKEHGAWNALLVSLCAGWMALAGWNPAAMAASLFWFSAFILRGPLSVVRQYRLADPRRFRRAWGYTLVLFGALALSGVLFYLTAPPKAALAVGAGALPLGFLLSLFAFYQRTLRFLAVEMGGFAGLCLLAPVIYLTRDGATWNRAFLIYVLFGGYFLLALLYVRARLGLKKRIGMGGSPGFSGRLYPYSGTLLAWLFYMLAVFWVSGKNWLPLAGPFYTGGRILAGALGEQAGLPAMKLGLQEMTHSLVFMAMVFFNWNLT
jgi:hypothetical protein